MQWVFCALSRMALYAELHAEQRGPLGPRPTEAPRGASLQTRGLGFTPAPT